jgi:hypothetical protein
MPTSELRSLVTDLLNSYLPAQTGLPRQERELLAKRIVDDVERYLFERVREEAGAATRQQSMA